MGRIDTQLAVINSGRYGQDVRMAIHDALDILEQTSPVGFPMPMDFKYDNSFNLLPIVDILDCTVTN